MKFANTVRLAAALIFLPMAAISAAAELPAPFEADYEGNKFPFSAKATIALQRIGDYYRYAMRGSVRAAFFKWSDVTDCSILRVQGERFFPVEYAHLDSRNPQRNLHARYDWERRALHIRRGDGAPEVVGDLPADAWDVMSVQLRLRADIAGAKPGTELAYDVIEKNHVKQQRLKIESFDDVQVGGRAMQIVSAEADDGKHRHEFWFAKNYAWLPVRIAISGVALDMVSSPEKAARAALPASNAVPSCE